MAEARHSFAPLLDALWRHRGALLGLYLVALILYALAVYRFDLFDAIEGLRYFIPGQDPVSTDFGEDDTYPASVGWALFALIAAQALFLLRGGKVTIDGEPAGKWRLLIPVAVGTALVAVLTVAIVFAILEMFDRGASAGSIRGLSLLPLNTSIVSLIAEIEVMLYVIIPIWVLWFAIGMYLLRKTDGETALARLSMALLAGSWVHFLVALPVDIAIRQRAEDCPCATGSWLGLMAGFPILIFAFGPGIFLLYVRETRLARHHPGRVLRILVRKSRRSYRSRA